MHLEPGQAHLTNTPDPRHEGRVKVETVEHGRQQARLRLVFERTKIDPCRAIPVEKRIRRQSLLPPEEQSHRTLLLEHVFLEQPRQRRLHDTTCRWFDRSAFA